MSVVTDLIEQQSITQDTKGYNATRVFLVDGVTGSSHERLFNAINDANIPDYDDIHPSISSIYVTKITGKPLGSNTQFQVNVYYSSVVDGTGSSNATARLVSSTAGDTTTLDANGDRMITKYVGGGVVEQWFKTDVERPRTTFEFEYIETSLPSGLVDTYVGKINLLAWNGYAINTILCTGITADSEGDNYRVRISFAYNKDTWLFTGNTSATPPVSAHPTDPDPDLDLTKGVKIFDVYLKVDFTPLGLTL